MTTPKAHHFLPIN